MANATIMTVIHLNWALHTSMYFFLFGLSCFEICYTFVICTLLCLQLNQPLFLWHFPCHKTGLHRHQPEGDGYLLPQHSVLIVISYVFIVSTILKISLAEGQHKAFATCVSHLTVVIFHYGFASFMYLRPTSLFSCYKDQLVAVTYTVITPLFSPLVCTLRNKEVKTALRKLLSRYLFPKTI
eukprot:bmy_19328T0